MAFEITVEKREQIGTKDLKPLREAGFIPGVVYGKKEKSTPIRLNERDFSKMLKEAGESSIIQLKGLGDDLDVLIHDVDYEPVRGAARHVDFYAIERGKKLTVSVPLEFVGVSGAVKDLGGILVKVMHEIEIEVLPRDLPQHIDVDISAIKDFETSLHIKDLKLPEGAEATADPEEVVASASAAVEEVFEEPEEVDMDAIGDSVAKGKGEDESADVEGEDKSSE
jgi:large subunit ribosomal protein L25